MTLSRPIITKILEGGRVEERVLDAQPLVITEDMIPFPRDRRGRRTINPELAELTEAVTLGSAQTANFPDLLRQGIQFISMQSYAMEPVVFPQIVGDEVQSNKHQEEYLLDAAMGNAPIVPEGADYPDATIALETGVIIKNYKRGYVVPVTEEMRRFDQVGKVEQIAEAVGRSLRITEEDVVLAAMTDTSNYTHSNTAATTFSADGLITAYNALVTMRDRSGNFLGVRPDTLIVTPQVYFAALQLLRSQQVMRAHAQHDSTVITVEKYGTGVTNPFYGLVDTIIMTPRLGSSYQWLLGQRGRGLKFQRVDPARVLPPEYYPANDTWKYYARTWFGFGFVDDRFWYYSSSTTAPTVT